MKKALRNVFLKPLLKVRARLLGPHINASVKDCDSILDLGCGDGVLASYLKKRCHQNITSIDTIDSNLTKMKVQLYDGQKLPFPDKSFDATMVVFVLHHCQNIEDMLREIVWVTRKKIVIFEEVYTGDISKFFLEWHDKGNILYSSKMDIPLNFKTRDGWKELFVKMGLNVTRTKRVFQYPILNMTNQIFFEITI